MKAEIDPEPQTYRWLWANREQLYGFVWKLDEDDSTVTTELANHRLTAEAFFYKWCAKAWGRSPEKIRQTISRRNPKRRTRRFFPARNG